MFGFFEKKYFLGIDFGTFSIKAVEIVVEKGKARLVNFGIADIYEDETSGSSAGVSYEERRLRYLLALLKRMQPHTKNVNVAIPGSSGLIAIVELPKMSGKELAEAIQFEAHRYVPIDMNEVVLSWDKVKNARKGKEEGDAKGIKQREKVILVAALKKEVRSIAETIQKSGCSVETLELEVFSLARALVGNDPGTYLIIDMGFHVSNLVLVHEGEVHINRTVDVGGNDVTKTIADGMNISFDRAEEMKKQKNFFHQTEIPLTFPSVDVVLDEARRVLAQFSRQNPNEQVDAVIFSGGSSHLLGLDGYFSEQIGMTLVKGDPWKRIVCSEDQIASPMREALGGSLTIALGLALQGVEIAEKK